MMVVFYHASPFIPAAPSEKIGFAEIGFAGVDLFFVISGFIMWHTTRHKNGLRDAMRFQVQRFGRIFLGYWPFFALSFVVFVLIGEKSYSVSSLLMSLLLWPQALSETLLPVSWTLSFELYFYSLFALLLALNLRPRCVPVLWTIIAAVVLINVIAYKLGFYAKENFSSTHKLLRFVISPLTIEFFVGCLIGYWVQTRRVNFGPVLVLLGVVGMVLVAIHESNLSGDQSLALGYNSYARVMFLIAPTAAIVAGLAFMEKQGMVIFSRMGVVLGGASYAIYLLHTILLHLGPGSSLTRSNSETVGLMAGLVMLTIVVTLAISVVYARYLETPLYFRYKRKVDRFFSPGANCSRRASTS